VTRLQTGRSGIRIPASARDFCLLENVQTGSGAYPASCSVGTVAVCPEVARPEREVSDSPTPTAEVKNLWNWTSTLLVCLYAMCRENSHPLLCFNIQTDWGSSSHQSNGRIVRVFFREEQMAMEKI